MHPEVKKHLASHIPRKLRLATTLAINLTVVPYDFQLAIAERAMNKRLGVHQGQELIDRVLSETGYQRRDGRGRKAPKHQWNKMRTLFERSTSKIEIKFGTVQELERILSIRTPAEMEEILRKGKKLKQQLDLLLKRLERNLEKKIKKN